MSILEFMKNQKIHIVYGGIIVGLAAVGYNILSSKPKEIVKTVVQTKVVDRNIVKTQKQYIDRVIVKKETNGDVTTTTEHESKDNSTVDKSKSNVKFVSSTSISYLSRYSLDVQYPLTFTGLTSPFDPKKLILTGGYRVFNTPLFVTLGTNIGLDSILVGIRYEF